MGIFTCNELIHTISLLGKERIYICLPLRIDSATGYTCRHVSQDTYAVSNSLDLDIYKVACREACQYMCKTCCYPLPLHTHTHTHPQVSKSCLLRWHFIARGVLLVGNHSPILRAFSGAGAGFTEAAFATATPVGAGASAPVAGLL